jgi:DNA-binding IclR family transcriptional regulator
MEDIESRAGHSGPRAVLRAMEVLRELSSSPSGIGLSRMAANLQLPKSSLLALLRILAKGGYVSQQRDLYILGSSALKLAMSISAAQPYPACLMPKLKQLAEITNETVSLGEHSDDGRHICYLEALESNHSLRLGRPRSSRAPIHASSNGQALLAFMPQALLDDLLSQPSLKAVTKDTPKRQELIEKVNEIRRTGIARSEGGQEPGAMGFGAPVFDATGELRCAVAAGGPISRVRKKEDTFRRLVLDAGEEMSRILGYRGEYPKPYEGAPLRTGGRPVQAVRRQASFE